VRFTTGKKQSSMSRNANRNGKFRLYRVSRLGNFTESDIPRSKSNYVLKIEIETNQDNWSSISVLETALDCSRICFKYQIYLTLSSRSVQFSHRKQNLINRSALLALLALDIFVFTLFKAKYVFISF